MAELFDVQISMYAPVFSGSEEECYVEIENIRKREIDEWQKEHNKVKDNLRKMNPELSEEVIELMTYAKTGILFPTHTGYIIKI